MKYASLIIWIFGIAFLGSCKNREKESSDLPQDLNRQERVVYRRLMAVHDSAMAKMGAIERAIQTLQHIKETEHKSTDVKSRIDSSILLLKRADEAMWDWMYHFKQKGDWSGKGTYLSYLQSEERKIQRVATLIDSALQRASQYTNKEK